MEIYNEFRKIDNVSLALGFFDGVHKGHQVVLSKYNESKLAVITFKKHPLEVFGKPCSYLSTLEKRADLIEKTGADYLFELDFTEEFSKITGEKYLQTLIEYFHPTFITTGFNHTFGSDMRGAKLLEEMQGKYNYKYIQIPPQKYNDEIISSSLIREYICKGDIHTANCMLGHRFSVKGKVIKGNQLGRQIGFPTANILYPSKTVNIPYGVYCTEVNGMRAVTNYGIKPTIGNYTPVMETHIIGFDKNIYGQDIEVEFIRKIRDEKKFDSINDLKLQIIKDTEECSK